MCVSNKSGRNRTGDFEDGRGNNQKNAVDEIILPGLTGEYTDQPLTDQSHTGYFNQRLERANNE